MTTTVYGLFSRRDVKNYRLGRFFNMKNEVDSENQKVREISDIFSIEIVSGGGRKDAGRERQFRSKS